MCTDMSLKSIVLVSGTFLIAANFPMIELDASSVSVAKRIQTRSYPSVFQAWHPIDMTEYPLGSNEDRLRAAAKHDVLWEEPVSQIRFNVELVLGAEWDHLHGGLATQFTRASLETALGTRLLAKHEY